MKKSLGLVLVSSLLSLALSSSALAFNYHELEVYGYNTESKGEKEFENQSSVSTGVSAENPDKTAVLRSQMEFAYGINDRTDIAGYATFTKAPEGSLQYMGARLRSRTRLFEKNELPVDIALYGELSAPLNDAAKLEAEFKPIIEKDFGRFTVALNPTVERALVTDGTEDPHFEFGYGASLAYRPSASWKPHLDFFGTFEGDESKSLVMPGVDVRLGHGVFAGASVGFGLTASTESTIGSAKIGFEF